MSEAIRANCMYMLCPRLEIDRNGNGAKIYAIAYHVNGKGNRCKPRYLHELIWEKHCGGIALGCVISHKNGITMDNRLDNLCLLSVSKHNHPQFVTKVFDIRSDSTSNREKNIEQSLYWAAIQQLPSHHVVDEHFNEMVNYSSSSRCLYDGNGDPIPEEEDMNNYYECHYPPCIKIEQEPREFSICGRCQQTRYCGALCQQRDWPLHKKYCRERNRSQLVSANYCFYLNKERTPER
ncbi:hypothetical protein B4U79_12860 [Dinothrombium tinctorium]|uniref:MYND-type domain-containing protein n=1 Tax=Dinothrombium tinctorium TaxID=1965070 RepID=A0A3S3PMY0_9ACAR|nr:hypothetical protein B4U79_02429 [Dinothrombium tinctorium]RWS10773.1 hypothetical protein B4U79_07005 [Dinothrombium tinctorium]RWS13051.1 hypothetical protein B4U79_12860 [Dinothrombium tinctorium]